MGSPRRFSTGLSHVWGIRYRKGRRTGKEASKEQLVRQIRARPSQRRQKPRWNKCYGFYKDKQKKQTPAVKPPDETQSLSSARFSASWPPFWHCSPLEPSILYMKLRGTSPMDTFLETCHCEWHFLVSKLDLSAGGSNMPSWRDTATPTIIETTQQTQETATPTIIETTKPWIWNSNHSLISSSTSSRQHGRPLAKGPHFSTTAAQGDWKEAKLHDLSEQQVVKIPYRYRTSLCKKTAQNSAHHVTPLSCTTRQATLTYRDDEISGCLQVCWQEASLGRGLRTKQNKQQPVLGEVDCPCLGRVQTTNAHICQECIN